MAGILDALNRADQITGCPTVIIADTIKGKGVIFAENQVSFHNGVLTEELYHKALEELS